MKSIEFQMVVSVFRLGNIEITRCASVGGGDFFNFDKPYTNHMHTGES